jgi:hypothetical protein
MLIKIVLKKSSLNVNTVDIINHLLGSDFIGPIAVDYYVKISSYWLMLSVYLSPKVITLSFA